MAQQEVRQGHPYFRHDAIHQQPAAVASMLERNRPGCGQVAALLSHQRHVYLVGIGTSWHAALTAEHWFRHLAPGQPEVQAWNSFEFVAYPPPLGPQDAVVVISHRGTKSYSYQALELAKGRGALGVAITSTNPGPRITVADFRLHTVEQERSAAFTVSYTAAMAVLALVAVELGGLTGVASRSGEAGELHRVPSLMRGVLAREGEVEELVRRYSDRERYLFTGWGPNAALAHEAALKIKETSYSSSEGLQVEHLLHGPFLATTPGSLLALIAPPGPGRRRSAELARAAAEIGTPVWALAEEGDGELARLATETFSLPPLLELWSPLVYVLPLQLFTYYLALARGCQPDLFRRHDPTFAAAMAHYSL